jgi:hypothetical protein
MAEDNKYDQESIRELLSWAQDTLNNKTYPEGGLVLDKCIKVIDCKSHIEAMIQIVAYILIILNSFIYNGRMNLFCAVCCIILAALTVWAPLVYVHPVSHIKRDDVISPFYSVAKLCVSFVFLFIE